MNQKEIDELSKILHHVKSDEFLNKNLKDDKYFKYSQRMLEKNNKFDIDYKKQLIILNRRLEKLQVEAHMDSMKDPNLNKMKSNM